jgi:hypothetical protein
MYLVYNKLLSSPRCLLSRRKNIDVGELLLFENQRYYTRSSPRWLPCRMDFVLLVWSLKHFNISTLIHVGALMYNKLFSSLRWPQSRWTNDMQCWRIATSKKQSFSPLLSSMIRMSNGCSVSSLKMKFRLQKCGCIASSFSSFLSSMTTKSKNERRCWRITVFENQSYPPRSSPRWLERRKAVLFLVWRWNILTPEVWMHNKLLSSFLSSMTIVSKNELRCCEIATFWQSNLFSSFLSSMTRKSNGCSVSSLRRNILDSRSVDA